MFLIIINVHLKYKNYDCRMCSLLAYGLFQPPLSSSVKWTIPELFHRSSQSDGEEQ